MAHPLNLLRIPATNSNGELRVPVYLLAGGVAPALRRRRSV